MRFLNLYGRPFFVHKSSEDIYGIASTWYKSKYGNITRTHLNEINFEDFIKKNETNIDCKINTLYINSFTYLDPKCFETFNKIITDHEFKTSNLIVHEDIIDPCFTSLIFKDHTVFDDCYFINNDFYMNKIILDKVLDIEEANQAK